MRVERLSARGLLAMPADQIARSTFSRMIDKYEMLKDDVSENSAQSAITTRR